MKTVVLLTAGIGSRMGKYAGVINKTLLPVNDKAIISHIIEQFDSSTQFVVALGFLSQDVRTYLELAHPNTKFSFVLVNNYDGPNSGPAHSLRRCHRVISGPFYLIACDAYYEGLNDIPTDKNYVGVSNVDVADSPAYCNVEMYDGRITKIVDKRYCDSGLAVNGAFYIKDTDQFWANLGDVELSSGWSGLDVHGFPLKWVDLGTFEKYQRFYLQNSPYDFSKTDEFLWIVGDNVIKWFKNHEIAEDRVRRAAYSPGIFPKIVKHKERFYTYKFVSGQTLYPIIDAHIFDELLAFLDFRVWHNLGRQLAASHCTDFYHTKTMKRLAMFREKYPNFNPKFINGNRMKVDIDNALQLIDWKSICNSDLEQRSTFIHGDLQFDNIVCSFPDTQGPSFTLLDWRQDFAGELLVGDLYYDAAKLLGGIILDYSTVKQNRFMFDENGDSVWFNFYHSRHHDELAASLRQRFPSPLIDQITTIIFLNMAPLHAAPFDKLLFSLALERLNELA